MRSLGTEQTDDSVRVNLLRVLADLAKSNAAPPYFASANVPDVLATVLNNHPPPLYGNGWGEWIWSIFSWGSDRKRVKAKDDGTANGHGSSSTEDAMIDYLSELSAPLQDVDLGAGISYHAIRCVSNLARNSATHDQLLEAGLLPLLCDALRKADVKHFEAADHQLAELVLCTILAVAALAKSAPEDVVAKKGHQRLLYFMRDSQDSVAQMYAAGGIRNLARHGDGTEANWRVHRELVVSGLVDALREAMRTEASAQTKTFAALAFGDLMTTRHHKADIIRSRLEPAFASFASLLNEKNPGVSRAVYRTLSALFGDKEARGLSGEATVVAPPALCKLLAESSGQIVNGAVVRGDVSALKAVRAMCNDEFLAHQMVDQGLLEVLVRGASKGKGEYWEQSIAALSILSGWEKLLPLVVPRGALRTVLVRPCLEHDGRWTAQFFANMARSDDHQVEIARSGLKILLLALGSDDEAAKREGARGLYNLCLGGVSKVMVAQGGSLGPLVKTVSASTGDSRRFALSTLVKISEGIEHAVKLIETDAISVMLNAAKEDPSVAKDVAFCICNLSQVVEMHGSLAKSGAAAWLVEMLSKNGGREADAVEVMYYAALGVCNLAYSAGITRSVLRESGAVPILTAISSPAMGSPTTVLIAKQALHNLKGMEKPGMLPVQRTGTQPLPA